MQKIFTNFHIAISKETYSGMGYNLNPSIDIAEKEPPSLNEFLVLLRKVGSKYGWHRRPKYLDYPAVSARLRSDTTRFFEITKDGKAIGYVLASKPENSLSWHYMEAAQGRKTIEIENFGLFNGYTGHDYGDTALPKALGVLLKDNDNVYLTTRSTNHKKVVPFYEDNGMTVIHHEVLADDLVPENDPRLKLEAA